MNEELRGLGYEAFSLEGGYASWLKKQLIKKLKETNPYVESNIFNSTKNVCLDTLLSYKQKGVTHNFLDTYNETGTDETIE